MPSSEVKIARQLWSVTMSTRPPAFSAASQEAGIQLRFDEAQTLDTIFLDIPASIFRTTICCAALLLLAGCLAPPKRHSWQVSREDLPQVRDSDSWPQLSTYDYVRASDSKRQDAVALLQEHSFVPLDASQLLIFAPSLSVRTGQAYLVRGACFSSHPSFTIIRFDGDTGRLLVQQFTYDGEMMMPFRWVAEPNALVVFLARAPEHIYPDAVLGGDWIFRGRKSNTLDRR
jgi:hypothetical protein